MLTIEKLPQGLAIVRNHFQAGNLEQTKQLCRELVQADPNDADLLCRIGMTAHRCGHSNIAVDYLMRAIERGGRQRGRESFLSVSRRRQRLPSQYCSAQYCSALRLH